jgi:predicted DNA-binding WGR domain protein
MTQYFEFQEENVSCFLEVTLDDRSVKLRSGQKGTTGANAVRVFQDAGQAAEEYDRVVQLMKENESHYFRLGYFRLGDDLAL